MTGSALVLASASPRRRRLVRWLSPDVRSIATEIEEDLTSPLPPAELAAALAAEKAAFVRQAGERCMVLAFDTIVVLDGQVFGKPASEADAKAMLQLLSGRRHEVVTGAAILPPDTEDMRIFSVSTYVRMRKLDEPSIDAWLAQGEALGCAGAYNIERHLASVEGDGCFQNVAGLPLCHVYREIASGRTGAVPEPVTCPLSACEAALGRPCPLGRQVCGRPR